MQILPVIRADGIDVNVSFVGVRCSVHQVTGKGGQPSLILCSQVDQKRNKGQRNIWVMWCQFQHLFSMLCFLFVATKLLIAPVVLLLVVVVGALALVIGNYTQDYTGINGLTPLLSLQEKVHVFAKLGMNPANRALICHNVVLGNNVAPLYLLN